VFVVGGVLPLLLTVALVLWLEESIRFLVVSGAPAGRIAGVLNRLTGSPAYGADATFVMGQQRDETLSRRPTREIFSKDYLRATVMLCLAAFVSQLIIVYVVTWMPLVMASIGMPVTKAILASVAYSVGGIFGALGLARIIDKRRSYGWLIATYFVSAVAVAGIGWSAADWYALLAVTALTGLLTVGANIVLSAYATTFYPTNIRSTGIGWVVGWGRIGAIAGALFGTALVKAGLSIEAGYAVAAIPAVIGGIAVALVGPRRTTDS
jgi:AAHS family 4-hydroxybenzoate transporter-like MFS transporter